MSAAPRNRASWLNQNYDKLILVAVLVALLGSASFLVMQVGWERQQLQGAWWEQPSAAPKKVLPVDLAEYNQRRQSFFEPFQVGGRSNALMVSEMRVSCVECEKPIGFFIAKCPFCGTEQPEHLDPEKADTDGDGIRDVLEAKFSLNPLDPSDAALDFDGDGFTNIEEILYGTNPRDAADYPPPVVKLRVGRVNRIPFQLRFQGEAKLPDDSVRFQLNLRTLEQTFFVQVGDEVDGFKVLEYQPKAPEGPTLIIQQKETMIPLVRGQAVTQQELIADMVFLIDRTRLRVKIGDVVNIKEHEYKIIDITREGVLIRDEKTGKDTLVGMITESERSALVGGGASAAVVPGGAPGTSALPARPVR